LFIFAGCFLQVCQIEKKLHPNLLQKNSQTQQKNSQISGNLYQNINFFTGNQSFTALLSFTLYFTRKRIGNGVTRVFSQVGQNLTEGVPRANTQKKIKK